MSKKKPIAIIGCLGVLVFLFGIKFSLAQDSSHVAPGLGKEDSYLDSNDAIGVRIIPNPEHYSIDRWYKNQGFSGSPQSLTVDGYEAIRDGRTIYVNAANVKEDPADSNRRLIYTNIYLISYNQNPSIKTVDILGQIIKNWKFNSDLQESSVAPPSCSISTNVCESDLDCSDNQFCALVPDKQANTCQLKDPSACLFDTDCPKSFFCDSVKAKIIRDVKRFGQVVEISEALTRNYAAFGYYPKISAGSYLSGQSISLWPSWSSVFLKELSLPLGFIDPINNLGYCPGFDKTTCWNASSSRFYQASSGTSGGSLVLPDKSYAYAYKSNNGQSFNLCSTLETAENKVGLNFRFSPPVPGVGNCIVDSHSNTSPRLVSAQLKGETGREFIGWVDFIDDQDNPLSWSMSLAGSNWGGAWPVMPVLQNTGNPSQKRVYAPRAGEPGTYKIKLDVSDGQGPLTTNYLDVVISNAKPFIEAENLNYNLNPNLPLVYNFYFSDDNFINYQAAYQVAKISGTNPAFDPLLSSASSFKKTIEQAGLNRYKVSYEYKIPTTFELGHKEEYVYRIRVTDKYEDSSSKDIKINIENNLPNLEFNCPSEARLGGKYSCLIGPKKQLGAGNQELEYSFTSNFTNLLFDYNSDPDSVILKSDRVSSTGVNSGIIKIKATNEYGASAERAFNFKINTYCGDGIKQSLEPNGEKRGGIYNDGYEDCDGLDGVASGISADERVSSSRPYRQYACSTFDSGTPYPIPNNNYCVFKSPAKGGGYCGDGYCQVKDAQGNNLENFQNCPKDCRHLCKPSCTNKQCGSDGCGGSCGTCDLVSETCYGGRCCSSEGTVSVFIFDDPVVLGGEMDSPAIFFNDKKFKLSYVSPGRYTTKVPVETGKNVLALDAQIKNLGSGLNVSLSHCSRQFIIPSNVKNVKCVNEIDPVADEYWFRKNYDDSAWPTANIGLYKGSPSIWAKDYDADHNRLNNAYCRYSFVSDIYSQDICSPNLINKECGSNICGSSYRPNYCQNESGEGDYYCNQSTNTCSCNGKTCADFGDTSRKEGSVCGPVDNGCGGTMDCGNNPVDPGLYCLLPDNKDYADCNPGKPFNTYQKKCWYKSFERSILVRQGDVPDIDKCAVSMVDAPECSSYPDPTCPSQCSTKILNKSFLDKDRCWSDFSELKNWVARKEWRCSSKTTEKIWYYGDTCFSDTGDKVKSNGTCGPCAPNCSNKQCGEGDGCGGVCKTGSCEDGKRCASGVCVSCDCQDTGCGKYNPCGNICFSEGVCETGKTCQKGACVSSVETCNCVGTSDLVGDCSAAIGETTPANCTSYQGCGCEGTSYCGDGICDESTEDCRSCSGDCKSCYCDEQSVCSELGDDGAIGGVCGEIKLENCSNTINCYPRPQEGNYCKLPNSIFTQQYLNENNAYNNWEFIDRGCNPSAPDYTYQKKCWYLDITRSLTLRQGDKAQANKCALEYSSEDPVCSMNTSPACPTDCSKKTLVGTSDKDSCIFWEKNWLGSVVQSWAERQEWACSYSSGRKLWYYGEECSSYEKISNTGTCGTCVPNCSNKTCGQSDGCGGSCTKCGLYQACVSGVCQYPVQLRLSVDDEYEFYLYDENNNELARGSGKDWRTISENTVMFSGGNYILSIKARNFTGREGIAAVLETGVKKNIFNAITIADISTNNNDVWKCNSGKSKNLSSWLPSACKAEPSSGWMFYGFNDSCWDKAKNVNNIGPGNGNALLVKQIWGRDSEGDDSTTACRLKFTMP